MENKNLAGAMKAFAKAAYSLKYEIFKELEHDEDVSFAAFTKEYPFEETFDEINTKIQNWVESFFQENE